MVRFYLRFQFLDEKLLMGPHSILNIYLFKYLKYVYIKYTFILHSIFPLKIPCEIAIGLIHKELCSSQAPESLYNILKQ